MMGESIEFPAQDGQLRGEEMRTPDEVAAMVRLKELGWGERRIAATVGCNRRTVRRYLAARVGSATERHGGRRRWMGWKLGWRSGFGAIVAMPM